jgi:hypothetical protein
MQSNGAPRGAYGLRLTGLEGCEHLLVSAEEAWPEFDVVVRASDDATVPEERLEERRACVRLRNGGWIDVERAEGRALFNVPTPLSNDEIVHPYLAPVAAVTSHWFGRESLHAGAVAVGGHAWGVVGDRMSGKSSLLAALAQTVPVLADDILVVDELEAFSGPRTVDLREDAAAALGIGESIGVAGARERWRLRLPDAPGRVRLAGWVFVEWGETIELRRLPASESVGRLLRNRGILVPPREPGAFLQLAALPAWELRRPRSWGAVPDVVERVLEAAAG